VPGWEQRAIGRIGKRPGHRRDAVEKVIEQAVAVLGED
jgi:hypothetical protein